MPITNIDPVAEFLADLIEMGNLYKTKFFMKPHPRIVRKGYACDRSMEDVIGLYGRNEDIEKGVTYPTPRQAILIIN